MFDQLTFINPPHLKFIAASATGCARRRGRTPECGGGSRIGGGGGRRRRLGAPETPVGSARGRGIERDEVPCFLFLDRIASQALIYKQNYASLNLIYDVSIPWNGLC
jgi:hypothetical protein